MRRRSATIRNCESQAAVLGLDAEAAFNRSKMILKLYRNVNWALGERTNDLLISTAELVDHNLDHGLRYLADFAPDMDAQKFEEQVCCIMHTRLLIELINRTLVRLKEHPSRGKMYYEILKRRYIDGHTEKELLEELHMERSTFYDRQREAIFLFSICLFGFTIPEIQMKSAPT